MLLIAFGTRPEWIKLKPVIDEIYGKIPYRLLNTGQHIDIIDDSVKQYECQSIKINSSIGNRLDSVLCSILSNIDNYLDGITHVLVQGDTTTVFAVALACFHRGIKVIHLEAGLRTYDNKRPYPEEFNRQAVSCIADIHLCATDISAENLRKENKQGDIFVIGNTVLDNIKSISNTGNDSVLVTLHRRENHSNIKEWFRSLESLAKENKDLKWVLPIHPNPNVINHKHILKNINVVDHLSHNELLNILSSARVVITDSGGIQEESAFLKKPCIVCRDKTERQEGLGEFSWLCTDPTMLKSLFYSLKNHKINESALCPYGDGNSSKRLLDILKRYMQ